jgi:(1->4)-alpha-D-glucan 1-alpha-D-glucosylmutase
MSVQSVTQPAPAASAPKSEERRLPLSTYRLQMHRGFTFQDAAQQAPYLARLGVTDCYASPYLKARPGSTHGYDICDHTALNPEIGDAEAYQAWTQALADRQMGQVLDFVPNHMAADPTANLWWRDVLENGPSSPYASFFDVDWDPIKPELKGKVLLPVLGDQYGLVLERGELALNFEEGALVLKYFEHRFPIDPRQAPRIYRLGVEGLQAELGPDDPALREFLSVLTALQNLPPTSDGDPARAAERHREKEVARERLARLAQESPRLRKHIEENVRLANGRPGQPRSFDTLHELLEAQAYRLAYWRTAGHEINYRRFFDINGLAGVRMEDPKVFEATHGLVLRLIRDGRVTGLRLDHVDGLYDPAGYFDRLQAAVRRERPGPDAFYVVVEKILSPTESLPSGWSVHGTSGYDFLNDLNGLFVNRRNAEKMRNLYGRFTGRRAPFAIETYVGKKLIITTSMSSELNVLADALNRVSERDRRSRDFTLDSLRDALREVVACFPVYRTYVSAAGWTEADKRVIETAIDRARRRNPAMDRSIFDFLRHVLLPSPPDPDTPDRDAAEQEYRRRLDFAMRFQQYTGPVQAKGLEDTAFYRYNVLVSLNEVGGSPERFGRTPEEFHEANLHRLRNHPAELLATATHDTKRGEDVRARIHALSDAPDEWRRRVFQWSRTLAGIKTDLEGVPAPDRNDEYLFYQTLVGAWPLGPDTGRAPEDFVARVREYMLKAIREAKLHTSWVNTHQGYEDAVRSFVDGALTGPRSGRFLASFRPFARRVARAGLVNSLAQLVLKLTSPGVPDIYQGTEFWDLSLVDPDNRRPVDFGARAAALEAMSPYLPGQNSAVGRTRWVGELLSRWEDGWIKLWVTACGLNLRKKHPVLFRKGEYQPLRVDGDRAENVVAFARRQEDTWLLAVVPRGTAALGGLSDVLPLGDPFWQEARLRLPGDFPGSALRNVLTGETVAVAGESGSRDIRLSEVFRTCPAAILGSDLDS